MTFPPSDVSLADLWRLARRSICKVETLPDYAGDDAERARRDAWRHGAPRPVRSVRTNPYLRAVAVTVLGGVRWERVRVVDDPPTEGQRYGMPGLVESQAAGEIVILLGRVAFDDVTAQLGRRVPDCWIFDRPEPGDDPDDPDTPVPYVAVQHFGPGGHFLAMTVPPADSPAAAEVLEAHVALMAAGPVELNTYLAQGADVRRASA